MISRGDNEKANRDVRAAGNFLTLCGFLKSRKSHHENLILKFIVNVLSETRNTVQTTYISSKSKYISKSSRSTVLQLDTGFAIMSSNHTKALTVQAIEYFRNFLE